MSSYGNKLFGLRDVKVTNITGTTQKDLPVSRTLGLRVRLKGGELSGDDALKAVVSFVEAVEWELEAGGIDLDALAIMVGNATVVAGTTPSETTTLSFDAGDDMPYFKLYGKSLGDGSDDVHVKLFKCKCTGQIEGSFQDGQFYITRCSGIAIDDGTNGIMDIVQNETAATLPTT